MTTTELLDRFMASPWARRGLVTPLELRVDAFLRGCQEDGGLGMAAPDAALCIRLYEAARVAKRRAA